MALSYGGSDALSLVEEPLPEPEPGEVRITARAISVNPIDHRVKVRALTPKPTSLGWGRLPV